VLPHPDGVRSVRRYVSGRTRADVVRKLDELRREAEAGFPTGETTGDYLAGWIVTVRPRLRAATHREYARHVADYWRPLAGIPLTKLTPATVEKTMAGLLERGLAAQTVRHARSTLRRALHDAQRDGLLTRNVAALARPPRIVRREMRSLTPAEVARLLAATADDPHGPLFAVAVGSGLRLGELLGLRWTDVDLDGRTLVVRRSLSRAHAGGYELAEPKTARSRRTVMLPAVAVDGLRRQKARQAVAQLAAGSAWQGGGLVFADPVGRPLAPSEVSRAFHVVAERLGLSVRLHDLRHTAASLMLAGGVPLKVVSEALGHSSIAITADVYSHVTPELRREAADAMDRALGAKA
jgi:integrase